jgi:uncharacterized membrane protein YkvA (DUF1232 family)
MPVTWPSQGPCTPLYVRLVSVCVVGYARSPHALISDAIPALGVALAS